MYFNKDAMKRLKYCQFIQKNFVTYLEGVRTSKYWLSSSNSNISETGYRTKNFLISKIVL